jgi:hypothetical protein
MADLCRQIDELHMIADTNGELPALRRILVRLRRDRDAQSAWAELEELLRRCGVPGGLGGGSADRTWRIGGLPEFGAGHPVQEGFVCPVDRCARVELPDADPNAMPTCGLHDRQPLRRVRV